MNIQKMYDLLKLLFFALISSFFLIQVSNAASLHLEWDSNDEEDLAGYRVYYGNSSGNYREPVDVENVTKHQLSGLNNEETYYIALTAYDKFNNESEKSNEISGVAQSPPGTPTINFTKNPVEVNEEVTACSDSTDPEGDSISYYWGFKLDGINITWWPGKICTPIKHGNAGTYTIYAKTEDAHGAQSEIGSNELIVRVPATTTVPVTTTAPATTTVPVTTTAPVTTTIPSDANPPEGSITIDNGHKNTESPYVTLSLFASKKDKELDGDALMMLSNNNKKWSDPEPYTTTKNWTLSSGKRTKTVYVKFRDAAGNWMTAPAQDQITLLNSKRKLQPTSIASSSELPPLWVKDKAIDEDFVTSWSTFLILFWQNEYFTLDLGKVMMLDRVDMYATRFFDRNLFPVDFTIEISKDMHTWEPLCTERGYTIKPDYSDSWDINCYQGRYIRINITKAKTFFFFFHLAQIAEVEVYGYDLTEQQPTERPVTTPSINTWNPAKEGQEETGEEPPIVAEILPIKPGIPGIPVITLN